MAPKRKRHISDPTEDRIALIFEAENRHRLRYNATRGIWYFWNGHAWQPDETGRVSDEIRAYCRQHGTPRMHTAAAVRGVESLCRTSLAFACRQRDFDRDPFQLGTPGGAVNLKTGRRVPATPDAMISRCTTVAPRAGEPSRWLQFLHEVTGGDAGQVRFLRQIAGYSLTGDTSEHALFFFYGDGGTGKSTYVNTLQRILGSYARTAPMATFTATSFDKHPTDLAMLAGARLVAANETEQGRSWAAERIKALTGGDSISARFMRQDFFEYDPAFKLLFVGNHAPNLETVDEAIRRRFIVVPFDIKPKVKDMRLNEKLSAEAPQILQWCIDGCLDWLAHGLVAPDKVVQATAVYFDDQDLFTRWLEERVDRTDSTKTTTKEEALTSWNAFRATAGDRPEQARHITQRLRRAGFTDGRSRDRTNRKRVWLGMELRP